MPARRRARPWRFARVAALPLLLLALAAHADTVTVFAAASLRESLDEVSRAFERASGHAVRVSYGASSALARQVEAGAPAQLFIAADTDWADYLESRGLARRDARTDLLGNDLVLVAPAASAVALRIAPGFALGAALGKGRLAVADPRAVPAGKYARAALESLGVWKGVERRLAPAENVRAALAFVARGYAPLGIVYRTDALAEKGVRIVDTFPAASHPAIVYPFVLLARADGAARELRDYCASAAARDIWRRHGFRLPG
jgi:molybdate transport system substrate-binding protein